MKYINKIGMMVVAGAALAITSCSDYSDYNTAPVDNNAAAGLTLYENIKSNPELSDFAAIIDKAGYANKLNAAQSYTLWAPANGTYDAKAILSQDSATIVDRFINQHIAQFSYPVSGDVDTRVITLNDKHHEFTNDKFDGLDVAKVNIPSSNGLMHIINGSSTYLPSIYQNLDNVTDTSIVKFIKAYDTKYINTRKSVKGPLVNGQQTYLDTVWTYTNPVIKSILRADIENEDSTYVMLLPTDDAWAAAVEKIKPDFNYITNFKYMNVAPEGKDPNTTAAASISATTAASEKAIAIDANLYNDSLPKRFITRNLVYSLSYPRNEIMLSEKGSASENDTIYSTTYNYLSGVKDVLSHCGAAERMSNGFVRPLTYLPFKSYETYEPILGYTRPLRTLGLKANTRYTTVAMLTDENTHKDPMFSELSDFLKTVIVPKTSDYLTWVVTDSTNFSSTSAKPELDFALRNVLSQKYKIYVVFCPLKSRQGVLINEPKDLYLRFDMACNKADGTQLYQRINVPGASKTSNDIIVPADGKFHAVELEYTFPISYYGIDAFPTLFISHTKSFTTTSNRNKYEQELRVAGVYLVPAGAEDYVNNMTY